MRSLIAALLACSASVVLAQSALWPPLPKDGFLVGRAATRADVEAQRAVFVAENNGVPLGKPLAIAIPQYAWHVDGSTRTPVIIIQAESAGGQSIVGAKRANGQYLAALLNEFELLGQERPKK
jgi:hypothetical protein